MNIGIVGLGLIGGSLGLDFKARQNYVWGISRNPDTCKQAVAIGAVDEASVDLADISQLAQTEVVFVCTPIDKILPAIATLAQHLPSTAIITDVGSVKSAIVDPALELWPRFVGSHPMAGTAFNGIKAAEFNLFQQRPCVLIPSSDAEAVQTLRSLWQSIGAVIYECSATEHDAAVAWISHLPVMVSASLILACQQEESALVSQLAKQLASSGFRDTSRVGGGNPELGSLMAEYNQPALLKSLQAYQNNLQKLIDCIAKGNWQELEQSLQIAQNLRPPYVDK